MGQINWGIYFSKNTYQVQRRAELGRFSMSIKLFYLREKKPVDALSGTEI